MSKKRTRNKTVRDWVRIRMRLLWMVMILVWFGLWCRAYQVQVIQGPELASMALRQHRVAEFGRGDRGEIFDRQGRLLAKSMDVQSVYARTLEIEDIPTTAVKLAAALEIPVERVRADLERPRNFVWVDRQISDRNARMVLDAGLRGIYLTEEPARFYPHGHLAGQLLGFVGLDGDGLAGIELVYDEILAGQKATFVVQRDASGRRMYLDVQGREEDLRGGNVTLTLDAQIQFFVEEALAQTVTEFNGKSGLALVVDVRSGDILALANYPFFNPNMPRRDPEQWRNRVFMDALEPGSTLKPVLMAAALEEGVISRDSQYFCENGQWRLTGVPIRDVREHGWLPAHKILRYSSNICSAKIGIDLGAVRYHAYLRKLGFGERTNLNLPGENPGLLRPPRSWFPVDLAAASFGQGLSANALQLAAAFLTLANDGVFKPLRLVLEPSAEESPPRVVFRQDVARIVMDMMREAVELGTGTRAQIPGVSGAGKTGTAQKATASGTYGDRYVASFAGFYPAERPEYFILVVVDEPHPQTFGGVVAAPTVREIGLRTLAYFGKLPEREPEAVALGQTLAAAERPGSMITAAVDQRRMETREGVVPDLVGMSLRRAVERLRAYGVMPAVEGHGGMVVRQAPEPGLDWPSGERHLTLWLESL